MSCGFALAAKSVFVRNDKALILRRSEKEIKSSVLNKNEKWDLPGGSVHFHENCIEGMLREISEETALKVRVVKPIRVFDAINSQIHMTIVTYVCIYRSGEVKLSEEHDRYYWLTLKEAEEMHLPGWLLKDMRSAFAEARRLRRRAAKALTYNE